jgi:hypothetical protein
MARAALDPNDGVFRRGRKRRHASSLRNHAAGGLFNIAPLSFTFRLSAVSASSSRTAARFHPRQYVAALARAISG